jgi:DMSO/TMAO reductase YedYZ molybdopterin-dependent catalytic subunit
MPLLARVAVAADDGGVDGSSDGTPVGRRVVLGLLGLAALGVVLGSKASSALTEISKNDPTGLTGLIPGGGRFRFYSVAGPVEEVPTGEYRLRVDGEVERPMEFTFADLAALPSTTLVKDVQCVTGWRVPDVEWAGVLLSHILAEVHPKPGATAVEFGSADGIYTESLTLEQALRPDVLVATQLDGEPVSNDHGGPVRLYVAPMYFYKSLKWLDRITHTRAVEPGYWEDLGYDVDAWVGRSNGRDDAPTV